MKFISDDGKKIGTKEEVLKYEEELKAKEEAKKKAKADLDERWNKIQKMVNVLNEAVNKYTEDSDEVINVSCYCDGNISITKNTKYNDWMNDVKKINDLFRV